MTERCIIIFFAFSILSVNVNAETLEAIRQQFEIYQRLPGEIEMLSTDNTREINNVLRRTEAKRLTVRKELDKALTEERPIRTMPGILIAENFAAPFIYYVMVERAFAKQALQQGKPDDTTQSIQYVYRLADELVNSGSLELRTTAARIRLQTLETVRLLLQNPLCRHEHHEQLHAIFYRYVHRRVTDETIWTRYREEGNRFFMETRRNGLDTTVSPRLLNELLERPALDEYTKAPAERFARDQSAFLRVMDILIEACEEPFFQRQPMLRQLDTELRDQQGTATEPVFATLLLQDVSETMRLLEQERTGMEMAYLALSVSLHGHNQQRTTNFLTGKEYQIILIPNGVMSTYEGNIKPFHVPFRAR